MRYCGSHFVGVFADDVSRPQHSPKGTMCNWPLPFKLPRFLRPERVPLRAASAFSLINCQFYSVNVLLALLANGFTSTRLDVCYRKSTLVIQSYAMIRSLNSEFSRKLYICINDYLNFTIKQISSLSD